MTVLWRRRRRRKVRSSLIFVLFCIAIIAYFFHSLGIEYRGKKVVVVVVVIIRPKSLKTLRSWGCCEVGASSRLLE